MFNFFFKFFNNQEKKSKELVQTINNLENKFKAFSDQELTDFSSAFKKDVLNNSKILDEMLPEAFALVRETAKRVLDQRHFDVQLMGGIALHQGKIAEMVTGEGKTLVATLPAYLNALTGKGVHIVTVNDYLARRDAVWMGQIYYALGLSVSCLTHEQAFIYDPAYRRQNFISQISNNEKDQERDILGSFKIVHDFLKPISRKEAYLTDITYGTNHEFGFDYLRDNLVYRLNDQVQRSHHYAIIDEVDSILIDEARTPLIISAPDQESSRYYRTFSQLVEYLNSEDDYIVDEKKRNVQITEKGIAKIEQQLNLKNIFDSENLRLVHYLNECLKAKSLFRRDRDYVVKNNEIIIVDEFTGRLLPGRRYSGGLHQAIEAKENVSVQQENKTFAQITIQNYFRLYKKIAGMTGTAQTSAEEFHKVYNLETVSVPPNKSLIRKNLPDLIYKDQQAKYAALVEEIKKRHQTGQPVLIGTTSIEKNEIVGELLRSEGLPYEILNAKNHEREGAIIAQAGKLGAITAATNMAGRGVDIILGGNPPDLTENQKIKELGGLHVIGTERHEARRVDNQLRGRSGRQGDPGSNQFFLSLDDDLLRIFGGEKIKKLMSAFNLPDDMPIESGAVSKAINQAQAKVEGINFDLRKHLLDYDDVLNRQRTAVYLKRQEVLLAAEQKQFKEWLADIFDSYADFFVSAVSGSPAINDWPFEEIKSFFLTTKLEVDNKVFDDFKNELIINQDINSARENLRRFLQEKIDKKLNAPLEPEKEKVLAMRVLRIMDLLWMENLENLEALQESVRIRAYGQHDPLIEYRREAHRLYKEMTRNFENFVFATIFQSLDKPLEDSALNDPLIAGETLAKGDKKIGRNDPCPCNSGKKYKKCHGS